MSSRIRPAPVRFGQEQPCNFECLDELFEAEYAPVHTRAIHLGCGMGRTSVNLAQRGLQVLGIDQDRNLLAAARERIVMAGLEIDLMAGSPLELPPLPEESFALAVDFWTAAEVPSGAEREAYLRRIYRMLMRKGILLASSPPPRRKQSRTDRTFAFAGAFVSDFTRAGFEVLFEGIRQIPSGEERLVVHARKPGD